MIIDGKAIASEIESEIKEAISRLRGRPPCIAFIRVGEDPASIAYLNMKQKKAEEVGILSVYKVFHASAPEKEILEEIARLNLDASVDGILVQLPLPSPLNPKTILEAIDPEKDVDGLTTINMGKLFLGDRSGFIPCTPQGVLVLLKKSGIAVEGKHVVIIGRSHLVGKPLASLLLEKMPGANATVTVAHSGSKDLSAITRSADILIAAAGSAKMIKKEMIKKGAVIIDVGINKSDDRLVGDVDFEAVNELASHITPVPGGVGPMTIAMLLSNTLLSYQRRNQ